MVSTKKPFRPFQLSSRLDGSGLGIVPPNGGWMTCVIVIGLV